MQLDIKRYLNRQEQDLHSEYRLDLSGRGLLPELTLAEPVQVAYSCRYNGAEAVELSLEIAFKAKAQCARCLAEFERSWRFTPAYTLREKDYECAEPELPFTPDGRLDLDELCYAEILLGLPSVIVCSPSCKGLCPVCGKPRALGCGCEEKAEGNVQAFSRLLS